MARGNRFEASHGGFEGMRRGSVESMRNAGTLRSYDSVAPDTPSALIPRDAPGHAAYLSNVSAGPVATTSFSATTTSVTITDPLYVQQWHMTRIGDLETIWEEFTGAGVKVGVYDDGVESTHPDLAANYDASLQPIYQGETYNAGFGFHGNAVAGLIAAALNGIGVVGVAHGSTFASIDVFTSTGPMRTDAGYYAAFASTNFDVVNNSWGFNAANYNPTFNRATSGSYVNQLGSAWASTAENGRGGLGTVIVKAAGEQQPECERR